MTGTCLVLVDSLDEQLAALAFVGHDLRIALGQRMRLNPGEPHGPSASGAGVGIGRIFRIYECAQGRRPFEGRGRRIAHG